MNKNKIAILKQIRESKQQQYEYLETLPDNFQELVQDNEYANCLHDQCDTLMQELFADDYEAVLWFLYEFEAGRTPGPHLIEADGTAYMFETDDDYYSYLEAL